MSPILVVGKSGQLAQAFAHMGKGSIYFRGGGDHDFFNLDATCALIEDLGIRRIINTAAYTAVDLAESEQEAAHHLNVTLPHTLARAARRTGAHLTHISTDYVFDGTRAVGEYYTPEDEPGPINVYGQTKLAGERAVHEVDPTALILRTSWLHSPFGKNFQTTMERLLRERAALRVVNDQWGTPTDARDLAAACLGLDPADIGADIHHLQHFSGGVSMTWFDLVGKLKQDLGLHEKGARLIPILTSEYPTAAKRGGNTSLAPTFPPPVLNS